MHILEQTAEESHSANNLLWRDVLRGSKAVPQDVPQVESTGRPDEDFQYIHLTH